MAAFKSVGTGQSSWFPSKRRVLAVIL